MKNKTLLKVFLFFLFFFILQFFVGRILRGDYNSFARIMMQELHTDENIEVLFLGDSHIYRGIDTNKFKEYTNKDCFIAGFPGQEIDATYAILQEAKYFHPEIKEVFIDLDVTQIYNEDFFYRTQFKHVFACSNYLKNPKIKFNYLVHATSPYYYLNSILEIGKNRFNAKPKSMLKTVKSYFTGDYFKFSYPEIKNDKFEGRGFVSCSISNSTVFSQNTEIETIDISKISKDFFKTINKIIDFCEKNELELSFTSVPETTYKLLKYDNYDIYHDFINSYLDDYSIQFYDLNLLKNDNLNLKTTDYYDAEHLNYKGAGKITKAFCNLLKSDSKAEFFYDSFAEKLLYQEEKVFGLDLIENSNGKSFELFPIGNIKEDSTITYKIYNIENKSKSELLTTNNSIIEYPVHSKGKLLIECYLNENLQCSIEKDYYTNWIK